MTGPIEVIMIHGCLCATADCVTADIVLALRVYCLFYKFIKGITAYTKELRGVFAWEIWDGRLSVYDLYEI